MSIILSISYALRNKHNIWNITDGCKTGKLGGFFGSTTRRAVTIRRFSGEAIMAGEFVTLPHPMERDIELLSEIGNLTGLENNCTKCKNGSLSLDLGEDGEAAHQAWVWASKDVLYIAFPIMFGWGIFTALINLIVLGRQSHASTNTYMLGLVTSSLGLLVCGGLLKTQMYFGDFDTYHYMYGNLKSLNDWFWYTSLWLLVVMTLERSMTVTQNRPKSVCNSTQAVVIAIMVFCVSLISALPEFWEFEVVTTFDYGTNQTFVLTQTSATAETPEYRIMYFWYTMSIIIFMPYPILIIMTVLLMRGMKKSSHSRRRLSMKHTTGSILNRKVTEELHITRLFVVLIVLYLLFTGPFTVLRLLERIVPQFLLTNENLYKGLTDLFEFSFYFYFSIEFLLFCSYSDKFRYSLVRSFCCCCPRSQCCDSKCEWQAVNTKPQAR